MKNIEKSIKGEMTQQALNEMITQHEQWLLNPNSGKRMRLMEIDISGLVLKGNLTDSIFSDCDFSYTVLEDSDLKRASFTDCDLIGVSLKSCECNNASFLNCDFTRCEINTLKSSESLYLNNCNLSKGIIQNVIVKNADFNMVDFSDVILKNVKLLEESKISSIFLRASVFDSSFVKCELIFINYTDVTLSNVFYDDSKINLVSPAINVNFTDKVSLKGISLNGQVINCNFSGVDFRGSEDTGSIFNDVIFTNCNLSDTRLDNGRFMRTKFIKCDMRNSVISGADFRLGELTDCDASNLKANDIKAYKTNFSNSVLISAEFVNSHLSRTVLSDTKLDGIRFDFADLTLANLNNATVEQTVFAGANLNGAIYIDGQTCLVGSLGFCRKLPGGTPVE